MDQYIAAERKVHILKDDMKDRYSATEARKHVLSGFHDPVWRELATAACEMAGIAIYGRRHIAFVREEYGCCIMHTKLPEENVNAIIEHPGRYCYLELEYY